MSERYAEEARIRARIREALSMPATAQEDALLKIVLANWKHGRDAGLREAVSMLESATPDQRAGSGVVTSKILGRQGS